MTKCTVDNSLISINNSAINTLNSVFSKNYTSAEDVNKEFKSTTDLVSELFEKLVPGIGCAKTVAGECIRAINRVGYRYYNDGDVVGYGYGVETASSSLGYIVSQIPEVEYIADCMITYTDMCDAYENKLNHLIEESIKYLLTKYADYFNLPNNDDSCDGWSGVLFDDYSERANYPDCDEDDEYDDYDDYDEDDYDEDDEYVA